MLASVRGRTAFQAARVAAGEAVWAAAPVSIALDLSLRPQGGLEGRASVAGQFMILYEDRALHRTKLLRCVAGIGGDDPFGPCNASVRPCERSKALQCQRAVPPGIASLRWQRRESQCQRTALHLVWRMARVRRARPELTTKALRLLRQRAPVGPAIFSAAPSHVATKHRHLAIFSVSKILPLSSSATSDAGSGFWHSDSGFSQKFEFGNIWNRLRATAPRQVSGSLT